MADQEVIKHGQKIIRLASSKEHPLPHKLREIAIEFFTIVFAVSLSIWLHGLSEHHHQQQEVRAFLSGLRTDLAADIEQVDDIAKAYRGFNSNFTYLAALEAGQKPDEKTFARVVAASDANYHFRPNISRYEGFRSSGKMAYIEDQQLLDTIFNLYQMALPQIRSSEGGWLNRQDKLRTYQDNELNGDELDEHFRVFTSPKGKRLVKMMIAPEQLFKRYANYADQSRAIIKAIDATYPEFAPAKKD
ncbi:DUF6090 family protein [Massilia sp. LjRoot122]|uniref:DUF6090 family protein n=1 Tax=Massilia sp. LjRoot122 TaxID=3342257 RepID=UPI003ECDC55C